MQTPLPEKIKIALLGRDWETIEAVNSLIDCVDELRKERENITAPWNAIDELPPLPPPPVTTIEEMKDFKDRLLEVCVASGIHMCPGCGLTPKGLERIITLAQDQRTAEYNKVFAELAREYKADDEYSSGYYLQVFDDIQERLTSLGNKSV